MQINVPDDIMARAELGISDTLLALAVQLYADNRIDHADACRLADTSAGAFNAELLRNGLSVQQYPSVHLTSQRSAG